MSRCSVSNSADSPPRIKVSRCICRAGSKWSERSARALCRRPPSAQDSVVGAGGSSFQILTRLVQRLPVMLCPKWTQTLTQAIALPDVVEVIAGLVGAPDAIGAVRNVGRPDVLSSREMMQQTATLFGKRARTFSLPRFTPGLSRLWVTLVTQTPRAPVAPLIQSLQHPMVSSGDDWAKRLGRPGRGFEESVAWTLYAVTQELMHRWVMRRVERHLVTR